MVRSQHYVPQFYLRIFAGSDGRLGVFDKQTRKRFRASPADIACENFFYDVEGVAPGEPFHEFMEDFFRSFEGDAAKAHHKVLGELESGTFQIIGDSDREILATHIALQWLRTREARATFVELIETFREAHVRTMLEVEKPELADAPFRLRIDKTAHSAVHAWALLNGEPLRSITDALLSHLWIIARDGTQRDFYTSDHPVTKQSNAPRPFRGTGFRTHGVEVMYPLSPEYILLIVERTAHPFNVQDDRRLLAEQTSGENMDYYNSLRVRDAHRFVVSKGDDFDFADRYCESFPDTCDPSEPRVRVYGGRWTI